jgi:hypothetical protein
MVGAGNALQPAHRLQCQRQRARIVAPDLVDDGDVIQAAQRQDVVGPELALGEGEGVAGDQQRLGIAAGGERRAPRRLDALELGLGGEDRSALRRRRRGHGKGAGGQRQAKDWEVSTYGHAGSLSGRTPLLASRAGLWRFAAHALQSLTWG